MNIKLRALMISVAAGFGILFVAQIITTIPDYLVFIPSFDYSDTSATQSIIMLTFVLKCIGMVGGLAAYIGAGALYSYLHIREDMLIISDGTIGGATSSMISGMINTISAVCINLLAIPILAQQIEGGIPNEAAGLLLAGGVFGSVLTVIKGVCISIVAGGLLGAGGGAAVGAMMANK